MEKIKAFLYKDFEKILVLSLTFGIICVNFLVIQKMVFLNFYYLPVLISGYFLGRKNAILTGILSIGLVTFLAILYPHTFITKSGESRLYLDLIIWGGFLLLAAHIVGVLYEQKEKKINELKQAYVGVVEILSKYLESADRYTKGHSVRVADLATEAATLMHLPYQEVENIRVAALLHDIGKIEISTELISKAASLTIEEKKTMDTHVDKAAELLTTVGPVLKDAIPIMSAHHAYFIENGTYQDGKYLQIPLGARILSVADSFDAMISDRPYRAGMQIWQAMEELEKGAGTQFDPEVIKVFRDVVVRKKEKIEQSTSTSKIRLFT
jgi:putative nucleotidyltransferase with HDIG domain